MTSNSSTNQRQNFSLCQMDFKYAVLDFCPLSCQLAWNTCFFSSSISPLTLLEYAERKGTDKTEKE